MDEFCMHGRLSTQDRSLRAFNSPAFNPLRGQPILESTAEDFLRLMKERGPSLIHYLRRLHNLALNLGWLLWPILNKASWPKPQHFGKRAITEHEYRCIIKAERNQERRQYYELLWETGATQMDAARLTAENIDWEAMTLTYQRQKLREDSEPCVLRIGPRLTSILKALPKFGSLFPSPFQNWKQGKSSGVPAALSSDSHQRHHASQFSILVGRASIHRRISRIMGAVGGLVAIRIKPEPFVKEYKISVKLPVCESHKQSKTLKPIYIDYKKYRITIPVNREFMKQWKKA